MSESGTEVSSGPGEVATSLSRGTNWWGAFVIGLADTILVTGIVPFAVAAYITSAYWFTSSTSFANPAVTLARSLSDTFAGIRPTDVPLFVVAQLIGALAATLLFRWLVPRLDTAAKSILVSH